MHMEPAKRPLDPSGDFSASKRRPAAGETLFRILCPTDKTGGVIGMGGSIISRIRTETRSKIRIVDPQAGSEDRVIVISGDSSSSNAQMALVKVFERIVEGSESVTSQAVCRLLVGGSEAGCVLGKGGKVVERMRVESGASIRVLGKDHMPGCAEDGDEIINCVLECEQKGSSDTNLIQCVFTLRTEREPYVISQLVGFDFKDWRYGSAKFLSPYCEITGSLSSVRKALLSVSSCLQNNPRTEQANFSTTKSFGPAPRGSAPPVPVDPYAQRSYLRSLRAPDYHSRAYLSNMGIDITSTAQRSVMEEDVMFRMLCSNDRVGSIIGKAGIIIRALQSETGASIKIVDAISDSEERIIVISARENSEMKSSIAQDAVLRVHSRLAEGVDNGSMVPARLLVPAQQIGCLLGKGGSIIAEMRRTTGASIRIFSKEQVPKCAQPHDEVVQVLGTGQSVQDALFHITSRIRETIFCQKPHTSASVTPYLSAAHDVPHPLRSRKEPTSYGLDTIDRQPPLPYGVDHLGDDRVPFSYGSETNGLQPFDHSPPRSWGAQITSSGNSRSLPDAGTGLGFRAGMIGSVAHTPVATKTTVEVLVPQQFLGFVHGENDSHLTQIREISGAMITIYDPKLRATEGTVIISGTLDQTRAAQSLIHGFILHGKFLT